MQEAITEELQNVDSEGYTGSGPQNWEEQHKARCFTSLVPVEESNSGLSFPEPKPSNRRQLRKAHSFPRWNWSPQTAPNKLHTTSPPRGTYWEL